MIATGLKNDYFLFGLGSGERGFLDDLGCVHFIGFEGGEFITLGKATLNFKYLYFSQKTALSIPFNDYSGVMIALLDYVGIVNAVE